MDVLPEIVIHTTSGKTKNGMATVGDVQKTMALQKVWLFRHTRIRY